ncbi:peptidoglycan DD-metalloendopeptidase family protein [Mammaliicoccus lentus]|uniref:peptidoglycan DD-metalloendopeptidase family protein n=1 Tax=Mammaliicoccus lentus TaxID=42858 RepID=UPI003CEE6A97
MATIKELEAKFTSNASGMESAFTAMANKLNDIEKASDRAATSMEKNMSRGMNRVFKTGEGFKKVSGTLETISKKSVEMGSTLTNKITKPAMIAGGALAGITIGKGFGRLVEIDNAKAKLDGLGHSGKDVKGIMNNALESVKGTSFGLGEAATTASSAVAAGIEPGKELTRYLSLTGDAAAIAGTSMGEMGSIINKVQTSNKAYNGELQQLSERGIPIYQWIAKEAGVTADAVFDMARDGEISSEMFLNAIETNIGGAAKKMGAKSFTAGLANMWAAVGRLGASFLDAGGKGGGFFSKMKPLMAEFTNSLDGMESTAAKWGESLGRAFDKIIEGIRGIIGWYNSLDKNTQKLINSVMKWSALTLVAIGPILKIFGRLTGVIAAVFGPFGKFLQFIAKFSTATKSAEGAIAGVAKVFPRLGSALGLITGPVGWITLGIIALGTAFVVAYKKSETFRNGVNGAFEIIKVFTKGIGGAIISGLKNLGGWLGDVGKKAKDFGKALYDSWAKTEVGKKRIDEWNKFKGAAKKVFDTIANGSKRATDTTDALGEGVSKGTKKALQKYVDFSEGSIRALEKIKLDGGKLNKETQKELSDSIKNGAKESIKAVKNRNKEIESNLRKALENSVSISDEEKQKIIEKTQEASDEKVKKLEKLNEEIAKLEEKQYTDGKLTAKETELLKSKLKERNALTVEYVAKGVEEQQAILSRMDANVSGLSNQEIGKALKSNAKAEKKAIQEAAKIRDEGIREADKALQDGSIDKGEHRSIVLDLESEYNHAVDTAEKKSKEVQDSVEKGNAGIWEEMDREGNAYSGAEKMWNNYKLAMELFFNKTNIGIIFSSIGAAIKGALNTMFTAIGSTIGNFFIGIGQKIANWWNKGLEESKESFISIGQFLSRVVGGVGTFFTENAEHLRNAGSQIWNLIKQGWSLAYGGGAWVVNFLWNMLRTMGSTITNGAQTLWQGLKTAWDESKNITFTTWSWISGFFKSIWNGLWGTVRNISGWIWNKIKTIWDLVKSKTLTTYTWIRDFLFNIWQSVWGTIRNVGTWIWNKIRNTWNFVREKTATTYNWIKNFLFNIWQSIWGTIKNVANCIWNKIRNSWDAVRNKTQTTYNWIRDFLINIWNVIWNKIKNTANWIWNKIRGTWDNIRNKTSNIFNSIWGTIKRIWGLIWGYIKDTVNRIRNKVVNTWDNIRDRMWEIVTSIKNNVVNKFKDMYNGAKTWLDRIKSYLIGIKDKMASAAADLGISVANAAIRGLNKMINGINKISEGITDKKLINPIKEISGGSGTLGAQLSTGTGASKQVKTDSQGRLRHNTLATVNDKGPGNGKGRNGHQELIRNKNGSMFAPKGKDVLMNLRKGQSVISGRETQELSSAGLIPKFNSGTGFLGKIGGKWGAKLANTKHQTEDVAENASMAIDAAKTAGIKEGASALGHGMGNVMKWVDKPKELVETMMSKMGVNFDGIAGGTGKLVRGAYSKLIPNLIDKVKDMFSEVESGDGDASWLLNGKYPQLQPFGKYIGMTMNGTDNHYGLDFGMPTGTKIRALTAGKITQAGWVNTGGGNQVELKEPGGKWFQWYMHMSKVFAKAGQNVSAGDVIGLSGNTGSSNTPHLHIQRMKGYPSNDTAVDPTDWLKSLTGGGSGSGKWKSTVKKALVLAGLPTSSSYVNAWMKQIQTESGGNAKAMGGNDGLAEGNAMGLVQVKPGTFATNKFPGMGDIWNPLHNLVAGMRYAKGRYGSSLLSVIGHGHGYANGGIVNSPQMAWLAEGGFSESVISHDPSMKARSKVLYDKTGDMLGFNEDTELLREIIEQISVGNQLQSVNNRDTNRIANKDSNVYLDGKEITKSVSSKQGNMARNVGYNLGLGGV